MQEWYIQYLTTTGSHRPLFVTSDFKGVSFDDPKKGFALSFRGDAITEIIKLFLPLLCHTIQLVSYQRGQDLGYPFPETEKANLEMKEYQRAFDI